MRTYLPGDPAGFASGDTAIREAPLNAQFYSLMENNSIYTNRSYKYLFVYYEQSQNKRRLKKKL